MPTNETTIIENTPPPFLLVTSPMMRGSAVLEVQQKLTQLGYQAGDLDGAYGPTTAAAVRSFQRDHALEADGVVGPNTRTALAASTKMATAKSSDLGLLALAEAARHVGVVEAPPGSNRTPFGEWFGANGVAWCNIFVSWCFVKGAGYVIADGHPGGRGVGVFAGKGCSYVPTTEAWLRVSGMWLGRVPPMPGDIAIYNWDGGRPDHIGIVSRNLGAGEFEAIEGNTSTVNASNGGSVMRAVRRLGQVNGFGRVVSG